MLPASLGTRAVHVPFAAPCKGRFARLPIRPLASASTSETSKTETVLQEAQGIYVGKGRYLRSDPESKEVRAALATGRDSALTGGFAGGEVGLKQFISENGGPEAAKAAIAAGKPSEEQAKVASRDKGGLYIGKGRYLADDETSNMLRTVKATGRDSMLTGGFAGGEVGLRSYVETGNVPFAPEGLRKNQQSPLIIAGIVSAAAVTGGVLLTDISDVGERLVTGFTSVSPAALSGLDDNTKLLLETAILLVGVVATVVGGRAVVGSLTRSITESATKLATLAIFWVIVFIAARFILDSP